MDGWVAEGLPDRDCSKTSTAQVGREQFSLVESESRPASSSLAMSRAGRSLDESALIRFVLASSVKHSHFAPIDFGVQVLNAWWQATFPANDHVAREEMTWE